MRKELQPFEGRRVTFIGTFVRNATFKNKWGFQRKVLLKNIRDAKGRFMAQHVSLSDPSDVRALEGFDEGEVLQFSAIVYPYKKGYNGENIEVILTHPICTDYGLRDVQDIRCLSNVFYPIKEINTSLIQELIARKRISLGVC